MSEVPLYANYPDFVEVCEEYRGTSHKRNNPPPQDHHRALGIGLL